MAHTLNIVTSDHILAYVEDRLAAEERQDIEAAVRDDDRAADALRAAQSMAKETTRRPDSAHWDTPPKKFAKS